MANKYEVIDLHAKHPDWNSVQIARALDCCDAYVRATCQRNNLRLPTRPRLTEILDLGRACKAAGITIADILEIADRTVRRVS